MPFECKIKSSKPDLLLFVYGTGNLILKDINVFTIFFEKYLFGNIPYKLFIDLRNVTNATLEVLKELTKKMLYYEKHTQGKVIATVILVDSTIVENLIKMLMTIRKPLTPTKITSSIDDACNFLNEYSIEEL